MNEIKKRVFLRAIRQKIKQGENIEQILSVYTKLSEEEKTIIREEV